MPRNNDAPNPSRRSGTFIGVAIGALVVLMVVLHLTGVLGAGSH